MTVELWVIVCVLAMRPSHAPPAQREAIAQAFLANVQPHVPLDLLLAVGYVESRWNPTGSRADRERGMFGVMQLFAPTLVCHDRVGRPNERRCTRAQREARERMLDPSINVRRGATLLEHRWRLNHHGHARDWVGAYTVGSVPDPITPTFARYVLAVHRARGLVRSWARECERGAR
jgi:soluble lytic murein transglycosylase-like protein